MRVISSIFMICMMAICIAACGGGNSDQGNTAAPDNANVEQPAAELEQPDGNGKLAATIDIELVVEGDVETRTGTLAISDNGYYLYTLPQFKFTPEEPNTDQVYMDKYENYYMRIITLGAEPNLVDIRANVEEELKMLGDVVEMSAEQIGEPSLRDSALYLYSSDSTLTKEIIVRQIGGHYYKIIINMPSGEAVEGAGPSFQAMIKTIQLTRS